MAIDNDVILDEKTDVKVKRPHMYRVILLNDDYTPMEFVIVLIQHVFHKGAEEAIFLTLEIHNKGLAVCGVYTKEIAETKVMQVMDLAKGAGHPLMCRMERD